MINLEEIVRNEVPKWSEICMDDVTTSMKKALKQVIPLILAEVANSGQMELRKYIESGEYESVNLGQEIPTEREMEYFGISKSSITSLSESLIEKYTK